jgi:hypothetical protein
MIEQRRTIRTRIRAGAAAVAAAATLGLASPSAVASQPARAPQVVPAAGPVCIDWSGGARGCFIPHGDHIEVFDLASDGYRVEMTWATSYGRTGRCAIATGRDYRHCNYNMAEGRRIQVTLKVIHARTGSLEWSATEPTAI